MVGTSKKMPNPTSRKTAASPVTLTTHSRTGPASSSVKPTICHNTTSSRTVSWSLMAGMVGDGEMGSRSASFRGPRRFSTAFDNRGRWRLASRCFTDTFLSGVVSVLVTLEYCF